MVSSQDLEQMYLKSKNKNEIYLWCEVDDTVNDEDSEPPTKKKRDEQTISKRQEKENAVDAAFDELHTKHGDAYSKPQLKLWARMLANDLHDSYENPPNVPMITGATPKLQKKESLSEVVSNAAVAFAKAISPSQVQNPTTPSSPSHVCSRIPVGISPRKSVELRMKNLEQLRYLQQLFEDGILNDTEFLEQKRMIIDALRKL